MALDLLINENNLEDISWFSSESSKGVNDFFLGDLIPLEPIKAYG